MQPKPKNPVRFMNTLPDDETTTMIITITMSIRHPLSKDPVDWDDVLEDHKLLKHVVGNGSFNVEQVRVSCNISCGKFFTLRFFGCSEGTLAK